MKYIIDTEEKEIYVPDGITLLELLSLTTVLTEEVADYKVYFVDIVVEDVKSSINTTADDKLLDELLRDLYALKNIK